MSFARAIELRRRKSRQQMDRLAELVAEGWSVAAAGREIGVNQQRSSELFRRIKDELGPQAI